MAARSRKICHKVLFVLIRDKKKVYADFIEEQQLGGMRRVRLFGNKGDQGTLG